MRYTLLLIIFFTLLSIPLYSQSTTSSLPPSSSKECALCHYEWTEPFLTMQKGTEIVEYPKTKEVGEERMCFSCHDGSVGDSRFLLWGPHGENHKTGTPVKPGMTPPAILPLNNGEITCMTCHSAHGTAEVEDSLVETSIFLRMPNNESQLCKSCHIKMTSDMSHPLKAMTSSQMSTFKPGVVKLAENNIVICNTCHEPHGAPDAKLLRASGIGMELCKNCHIDHFPRDNANRDDLATGHIMNLEIDDEIVKEAIVRNSGRLGVSGDLVCFSCHSLHKAKSKYLLNRDNEESAFCRDCHMEQDTVFNSPHNMTKVEGYKTVNDKKSMDIGVCSSCHGSHNWQQRLPNIPADNMSKMCLSCHTKGETASKKPIMWNKFNHYLGDINDKQDEMLNNPLMGLLPENTQKFLDKYFEYDIPRGMRTPSTVTCMTCHEIHESETGGGMFLRESVSDGTLCISCHQDQKSVADTSHGTSKLTQSCMSCHNVHNSDNKYLVRKFENNDGCTSCHSIDVKPDDAKYMIEPMPEELTIHGFNHPVNKERKKQFPLPMKQRDDLKLSCISCHNPHAEQDNSSPVKRNFLWVDDQIDSMDKFCTACHKKQKDVITSDHSPSPESTIVANERTGRVAESCDSCHKVHNAKVEKYLFSIEGNYEDNNTFCITCHSIDSGAGHMAAKDKPADLMRGHNVGALKRPPKDPKFYTEVDGIYRIECFTCHDVHNNGPAYGTEGHFDSSFIKKLDPERSLCQACHKKQQNLALSGHYMDKFESEGEKVTLMKATGDTCGTCHSVHNSNPKYLMEGATTQDRCMTCHDQGELSNKTIMNSHKSEVILVDKNKANLPLEDGKIVCTTCHEPHSQEKALMRIDTTRTGDLCISCHETQQAVALSKHNMAISKVESKRAVRMSLDNPCIVCHATHNYDPDSFYMWPRKVDIDYNFTEDACADCHKVNGLAGNKVPKHMSHSRLLKMFPLQEHYRKYIHGFDGRMSENGDINCSTCHNPHMWSKDPSKLNEAIIQPDIDGDLSTSFLKGNVITGFCDVCHEDANERYEKFHGDEFRSDNGEKRGSLNKKDSNKRGILRKIFKTGEDYE